MNSKLQKKKRVSKKKKISWRKHVDISDVNDFLEDQRLEERIGKIELVFEDDKPTKQQPVLTSKQQKRLKLLGPPKCFSMLRSHTNVPDPITKRNRVRSKEERKNELVKRKEELMRKNGILKAKEKQAFKDRKLALERKRAAKENNIDFLWEKSDEILPAVENDPWVDPNTVRHSIAGIGRVRKPTPKAIQKKHSILPAVEIPHPGTSYNPSFEDHQDLLNTIIDKEKKIIKEEDHLNRVTRDMFRKVSEAERDNAWIVEMSEGLPKPTDSIENDSESEYTPLNPPVKNKEKTQKQKRKQKEQVDLERQRMLAKIEKKKIADLYKLRFIKKQIVKEEKKTKILQEKRKKAEEYKAKEAKRLGATKYEEPDIVFNVGEDISGNLRNMKKEGNLLVDRFKSMQKRNILEPTLRRNIKKSKIKRFKKEDHKDDWKKTVARTNL